MVKTTYNTIHGSKNDDFIYGTSQDDWIYRPFGEHVVHGRAGNDQILEVYEKSIKGSRLDDVVYGNKGNDTITTYYGNDILFGNVGDDRFDIARGNDVEVHGGKGHDILNLPNLTEDKWEITNAGHGVTVYSRDDHGHHQRITVTGIEEVWYSAVALEF